MRSRTPAHRSTPAATARPGPRRVASAMLDWSLAAALVAVNLLFFWGALVVWVDHTRGTSAAYELLPGGLEEPAEGSVLDRATDALVWLVPGPRDRR